MGDTLHVKHITHSDDMEIWAARWTRAIRAGAGIAEEAMQSPERKRQSSFSWLFFFSLLNQSPHIVSRYMSGNYLSSNKRVTWEMRKIELHSFFRQVSMTTRMNAIDQQLVTKATFDADELFSFTWNAKWKLNIQKLKWRYKRWVIVNKLYHLLDLTYIICCYWRRRRPQTPAEIPKLNALFRKIRRIILFSEVNTQLGTITWHSTEQASPISNFCENSHKNTGPSLHPPEEPAFYLLYVFSQSCGIPAIHVCMNSV